jgi:nucleotide-binding universal stress UspA family protein
MRNSEDTREIQRILVALDASPQSLVALDIAAEIATKYQAELIGIYVEDINLVRLANLPFSREIGRFSASSRPFDSSRLQNLMHAHARLVQRRLAYTARRTNLRWSMQITRGSISDELIMAAQESDLIILGKSGWSRRREPGSTAQSILTRTSRQALILSRKFQPGSPILVVFEGSQASRNALIAAAMIRVTENPLSVLILADSGDDAQHKQSEAEKILAPTGVQASYRWIPEVDSSRLVLLARLERCEVVVLPTQVKAFPGEDILRMLTESDCAVLLVR